MTRREWIEATKKRLDELDRSLTELETKASRAKDGASQELESRLKSTRQALQAARARWTGIQDTAAEVWETVSEEIATAWEANRDAIDHSVTELRNALDEGIPDGPRASEGDTVQVRYHGEFEDGTPLSSRNAPFEFTLGEQPPLPGLAKAVEGLKAGEAVSVTIPADDMFGQRNPELILKIPVSAFPGGTPPKLGDRFELRPEDGSPVTVTVCRVLDGLVEIDANHPLAGNDLHVDLEVVGVAPSAAD